MPSQERWFNLKVASLILIHIFHTVYHAIVRQLTYRFLHDRVPKQSTGEVVVKKEVIFRVVRPYLITLSSLSFWTRPNKEATIIPSILEGPSHQRL